jgi:transposase InsO family protein
LPVLAPSPHLLKPYTPRTNGKAERFIQTALREWAYGRTYRHSRERATYLPEWLHRYNWHRSHAALSVAHPSAGSVSRVTTC